MERWCEMITAIRNGCAFVIKKDIIEEKDNKIKPK